MRANACRADVQFPPLGRVRFHYTMQGPCFSIERGLFIMPVYKDEARGSWYVQFYYTDWTGARKKKFKRGFPRQKDAAAWERDFLAKEAGTPDMAFSALYELYMEDVRARIRPTTYQVKEAQFRRHILPYFAALPVNSITPATVRKWQNAMISARFSPQWGKPGQAEKPFSQTYLKTLNNQLSAVFNFAVKYYGLPQNPVRLAGSMGKKSADAMKFWTLEEFQTFIKAFPPVSMARAAFTLLFFSGMRSGELLALTPADFDFSAGTVSINKTYVRLHGVDMIQPPKTEKSRRTIPLPPSVIDMTAQYIRAMYGIGPDMRIFPVSKSFLNCAMARGCKKTGVKKIRVHDLRHSHASLLIEMGASPLLVKERLGHENIETTLQTYSHLYPAKQDALMGRLDVMAKK